jgi:hypothetical protein
MLILGHNTQISNFHNTLNVVNKTNLSWYFESEQEAGSEVVKIRS